MFIKEMKSLIVYALSKDITEIETKKGYNGAPILKLSSRDMEVVTDLKRWCENLGFECKILLKKQGDIPKAFREPEEYNLFCVFGKDTNNSDYYELL